MIGMTYILSTAMVYKTAEAPNREGWTVERCHQEGRGEPAVHLSFGMRFKSVFVAACVAACHAVVMRLLLPVIRPRMHD
jgi:hypothetical protein